MINVSIDGKSLRWLLDTVNTVVMLAEMTSTVSTVSGLDT